MGDAQTYDTLRRHALVRASLISYPIALAMLVAAYYLSSDTGWDWVGVVTVVAVATHLMMIPLRISEEMAAAKGVADEIGAAVRGERQRDDPEPDRQRLLERWEESASKYPALTRLASGIAVPIALAIAAAIITVVTR